MTRKDAQWMFSLLLKYETEFYKELHDVEKAAEAAKQKLFEHFTPEELEQEYRLGYR